MGLHLYFHVYVGSDHFSGFKILSFNIFWGFQKNKYFLGYEDFVDIFLGSSQNWTIFRGHFLCILWSFLKVLRTEWGIFFWVAKISNIFFECLKFLIFFRVNGRCCVRANVCRKK